MKMVYVGVILVLIIAVGMVYIRLAPSDPARWHVAIANYEVLTEGAPGHVHQLGPNGAVARLVPGQGETQSSLLERLDRVALDTPRTTRLAGNPDEGRITWVSRSAFFGFPDYTTAESGPDGVTLYARLRFGRSDFGVNAARLRGWFEVLGRR